MFVCTNCGLVHEPGEKGFVPFSARTAAVTTDLAVSGDVRYLAVWRLSVNIVSTCWDRIRKAAAPAEPVLYVPAFSLARAVVQQLGVSLTEAQPPLQLSEGLDLTALQRPILVDAAGAPDDDPARGPEFGVISPILCGRKDAHVLAHFVYLAVESHEAHELRSIDYELETTGEELVFLPAVWDPRYIYDSNWRLLLREFDGLVA
jgi:hypothetical protein